MVSRHETYEIVVRNEMSEYFFKLIHFGAYVPRKNENGVGVFVFSFPLAQVPHFYLVLLRISMKV
jgi:hypothetical protein